MKAPLDRTDFHALLVEQEVTLLLIMMPPHKDLNIKRKIVIFSYGLVHC